MSDKPDTLAHADDVELAEITTATTTVQVPGTAVETVADREAREALADEPTTDVAVNEHIAEYAQGVVTTDPAANLASRSNIVSDGRY